MNFRNISRHSLPPQSTPKGIQQTLRVCPHQTSCRRAQQRRAPRSWRRRACSLSGADVCLTDKRRLRTWWHHQRLSSHTAVLKRRGRCTTSFGVVDYQRMDPVLTHRFLMKLESTYFAGWRPADSAGRNPNPSLGAERVRASPSERS